MKRLVAPRPAALLTLLVLLAAPSAARAEFVSVARDYAAAVSTFDETPAEVAEETDDEPGPRPEEMAALLLWMIIGDVPVVQLSSNDPAPPGGGIPGDNPPGNDTPPEHAPEPASWLLAALGCGTVLGRAALRRERLTL